MHMHSQAFGNGLVEGDAIILQVQTHGSGVLTDALCAVY